jgi:squalene-hopene/tetraprenyl-beta-curcumene cyclase
LSIDRTQLADCLARCREALLAAREGRDHWTGRLSSSALATATAACALLAAGRREDLAAGGIDWLARNANADGGWGDTTLSASNVSTTLLVRCALELAGERAPVDAKRRADEWIADCRAGADGRAIAATVLRRYGDDRSFAAPILAACAAAGLLGEGADAWSLVPQLPLAAAALPHRLLRWMRLPVVSYALPALIAIGYLRHRRLPSGNPLRRLVNAAVAGRVLDRLSRIQPADGGFLEAAPLTAFVALSLVVAGAGDMAVVDKAVDFLASQARADGSWAIDADLSVWVTSLSVAALASFGDLAGVLPAEQAAATKAWLVNRQFQRVHPYTAARPGGWAWTDLPGGVPDADDTAGAILALHVLDRRDPASRRAAVNGARWLAGVQNRDGGVPTFCRGWGRLAFDRGSPDITAHAVAAWETLLSRPPTPEARMLTTCRDRALKYLAGARSADGAWSPLWFGSEDAPGQANLVYGTGRVLQGLARMPAPPEFARAGVRWLLTCQRSDGGWAAADAREATIEETAVAVDALACWLAKAGAPSDRSRIAGAVERGARWLIDRTGGAAHFPPAPIGLYFARLWYYEDLYPLIFTTGALGRAASVLP